VNCPQGGTSIGIGIAIPILRLVSNRYRIDTKVEVDFVDTRLVSTTILAQYRYRYRVCVSPLCPVHSPFSPLPHTTDTVYFTANNLLVLLCTYTHHVARSLQSSRIAMASFPLSSSSSSVPSVPLPLSTTIILSDTSVSSEDVSSSESGVWRWYKVGTGPDAGFNLCQYPRCHSRVKVQPSGQTSNMHKHLESMHKTTVPRRQLKSSLSSSRSSTSTSSSTLPKNISAFFKPHTATDTTDRPPTQRQRQQWTLMLLRMAAEMNVSFRSLCECQILRRFMAEEIGWNMPSRMTLHRLLPAYHAHLTTEVFWCTCACEYISDGFACVHK
jgi:hypothetical protein